MNVGHQRRHYIFQAEASSESRVVDEVCDDRQEVYQPVLYLNQLTSQARYCLRQVTDAPSLIAGAIGHDAGGRRAGCNQEPGDFWARVFRAVGDPFDVLISRSTLGVATQLHRYVGEGSTSGPTRNRREDGLEVEEGDGRLKRLESFS